VCRFVSPPGTAHFKHGLIFFFIWAVLCSEQFLMYFFLLKFLFLGLHLLSLPEFLDRFFKDLGEKEILRQHHKTYKTKEMRMENVSSY